MRLLPSLQRAPLAVLLVALALGIAVAALEWRARSSERPEPARRWSRLLPAATPDPSYVSSDKCRACHPDQYASWHASYHRTMTQVATPEAVVAPFDGRSFTQKGVDYRFFRRGDEFWVDYDAPKRPGGASRPGRIARRVVMVTGSHHQQRFWLAGEDRRLDLLPFAYLIEQERWVPGEAIFLTFPERRHGLNPGAWNQNCGFCHGTATQPQPSGDRRRPATAAAELGIACEACHGPAAEHVAANASPERRYRLHLDDEPDPTIVNPRRVSARRSAEICGQCHAITQAPHVAAARTRLRKGASYRPGDELESDTLLVVRYTDRATEPWHESWLEGSPTPMETNFWADGTIRVSGREYNGLLETGCFERGNLSCISCHSMHASDPDKQLAAGMEGDEACLQCHESYRQDLEAHTHHRPESVGSRCYNCHMPYTTHGLLRALRSHRIDSPSAAVSVGTGRPNACNLCHLDQTLAWTDQHLAEWYQAERTELSEQQTTVSAAPLWLLKGDAIQRTVTAWNMGWGPALETSGSDWQAPFLAELLTDPYTATRFNAFRSLRALPGYEALDYDYVGDPEQRERAKRQVLETFATQGTERAGAELLMTAEGRIPLAALEQLLQERDVRPVRINE